MIIHFSASLPHHQMVLVYKDPHGEKVFIGITHQYAVTTGKDEVENLRRRLRELEAAMALTQVQCVV